MTVPSTTNKTTYTGTGSDGPFPIGFTILEDDHLLVVRTVIATGAETTLTLDAGSNGYTVNDDLTDITLTEVLADSTEKLTITRAVPLTQGADYIANNPFPAEVTEQALDKLTMITQQLDESLGRTLKIPVSSATSISTSIPAPEANKTLAWNSTGTAIINGADNNDVSVVADNIDDINTVADAIGGSGLSLASGVSVNNSTFDVLTATNVQDALTETDSALFKARGTEVLGGTGAVTFTIGQTTFNVAAVTGQIKDDTGYYPISYAGESGVSVITTASPSIYVYIDKNGDLQQQTTEPTRTEYRQKLFLTRLAFSGGTLVAQEQIANPSGQYMNALRDYLTYVASPKLGLALSGNANLTFQVSAGSIFELGTANASSGDNPNTIEFSAQNPTSFFYVKQDATIATGQTSINVTQYDNGGTLTTMTNNRFKIMTVYKFNSGNHIVQEGQAQYASLDEAQTAISTRTFVPNPQVANGTRLGWIIVQKNATDLTNTSTARFVQDNGSFSTSIGTTGALLASNNLSDLQSASTSRTNLDVYSKAEVDALGSPNRVVSSGTFTTETTGGTIDLTGIASGKDALIRLKGITVGTDGVIFGFRVSTDGGSTFDSTSGRYDWIAHQFNDTAATSVAGNATTGNQFPIVYPTGAALLLGTGAGEGCDAVIRITLPSDDNGTRKKFRVEAAYTGTSANAIQCLGGGDFGLTDEITDLQLLADSGLATFSGTWVLEEV